MLYVIDDTANNDDDNERGNTGWMVTADESGDDIDEVVAYFKTEKEADEYVAWKNK